MTRWLTAVFGMVLLGLTALAPSASAETVSLETSMVPFGGKLYKEKAVPVQSTLAMQVGVPDDQSTILPLKRSVIHFDTDMSYNPDNSVTPVCPDSAVGPATNLALGMANVIDLCPKSVIGTGSSVIYLASSMNARLADPQLVIFNGGRDNKGNPKLKIYGFSKGTGSGLLMQGSLTPKGIQDVPVGVLSYDSAVGSFIFNLPGTGMKVEDSDAPGGFRTVKGLDPNYVRAKCSDGLWSTGGDFHLGKRDPATALDIGPTSIVPAPLFNDSCVGADGRAALARKSLKGPKVGSRGRRATYRVAVINKGTATARNVKVTATGGARGSAKSGSIAPGATRTITVSPRITARKGSSTTVKLTVSAAGSKITLSAALKVRR